MVVLFYISSHFFGYQVSVRLFTTPFRPFACAIASFVRSFSRPFPSLVCYMDRLELACSDSRPKPNLSADQTGHQPTVATSDGCLLLTSPQREWSHVFTMGMSNQLSSATTTSMALNADRLLVAATGECLVPSSRRRRSGFCAIEYIQTCTDSSGIDPV